MRRFGCLAFVKVKKQGKLDPVLVEGIFLRTLWLGDSRIRGRTDPRWSEKLSIKQKHPPTLPPCRGFEDHQNAMSLEHMLAKDRRW